MKRINGLQRGCALGCTLGLLALAPATQADEHDELEVTIQVLDEVDDLDDLSEMRGPDEDLVIDDEPTDEAV